MTEAEGFNHQGSNRYPSRFLLDIDPNTLQFSNKPADEELERARASYVATDRLLADRAQVAKISVGSRVRHAVFGEGVVSATDDVKRAYIVDFDGLDTSRSISFRARLEVVE